jgi:hypothetical protein
LTARYLAPCSSALFISRVSCSPSSRRPVACNTRDVIVSLISKPAISEPTLLLISWSAFSQLLKARLLGRLKVSLGRAGAPVQSDLHLSTFSRRSCAIKLVSFAVVSYFPSLVPHSTPLGLVLSCNNVEIPGGSVKMAECLTVTYS